MRRDTHVLLVDDNLAGLEILDARLKSLGCRTTLAHSGEVALDCLQRDAPDAVVLDVTMPELNGYQTCRAIKRHDPSISVVILTAKIDPADRFWAFQSGADEFLNKPIDPSVVVGRLEALLGRR